MFCAFCGTQIPTVAVFCTACGKKVPLPCDDVNAPRRVQEPLAAGPGAKPNPASDVNQPAHERARASRADLLVALRSGRSPITHHADVAYLELEQQGYCERGADGRLYLTDLGHAELSLADSARLDGVGGWLAFFCLCTIAIVPAFAVKSFIAMPSLITAPFLALGVLSLAAGISVGRRSSCALAMTNVYLWVDFAIAVAAIAAGALLANVPLISGGIEGAIGASIWLAYFARSRRVRATFGRNLKSWASPPDSPPPQPAL